MDPRPKGKAMRSLHVFFDVIHNKLLNERSSCQWFLDAKKVMRHNGTSTATIEYRVQQETPYEIDIIVTS